MSHEGFESWPADVDQLTVMKVIRPGYLYEKELLRPAGARVLRPME